MGVYQAQRKAVYCRPSIRAAGQEASLIAVYVHHTFATQLIENGVRLVDFEMLEHLRGMLRRAKGQGGRTTWLCSSELGTIRKSLKVIIRSPRTIIGAPGRVKRGMEG